MIKKAKYYYKLKNKQVKCTLCPHNCIINEGKYGICKVRKNAGGKLISENYAQISAIHSDPIEKKPLYHFYPGKNILSIGSLGCNLKCNFCQNSNISQTKVTDFNNSKIIYPEHIIKEAKRTRNNIGIAYTYNEPTVWYEFMYDTAKKAHKAKLKNVIVSNGYINKKPLNKIIKYIDAFNIDIKAFTETFYKEQTGSSLKPVLETVKIIANHKKHLELTNLIIPTLNDDESIFEEMINELVKIAGKNLILHISRYYPSYNMDIEHTPKETMIKLYNIAKKHLNYVYLGNIISEEGSNTICRVCNERLISRDKYYTRISNISKNRCMNCNTKIPIIN
ncbi:MAG: AmmeMemoRadiSam system radical SAM enzyme [Bacteroidales bacterium]|nr:AmmeMemoRadiSam system radical SAM enzyme [Bacteroidales bacterium]